MKKTTVLTFATLLSLASTAVAWTTIDLPNRVSFNNTAMTHLSDGRLVYAHDGSIYQQDTFGSAALSTYANAPTGDYGYITGNGFLGGGDFPVASVYEFTTSGTSTAFTSIGTQQNYGAVAYDGSSVLMVGGNGAGAVSEVGYFSSAGVYTSIVSNVSSFSGGITLDGSGNLYVANGNNNDIYSFSAAQVTASLAGTTLTVADGAFVANLGVSGSLAVDTLGRLYAAGYQMNGIQVFDLNTSVVSSIIPLEENANYVVSAFTDGSDDYVGWLNTGGFSAGDSVVYGYELDGSIVVPEPSAYALLAGLLSCAAVCVRRRK
jgi:hypothetical protein